MFLTHLAAEGLIRLARSLKKGVSDMPRKTRTASEKQISDAEIITATHPQENRMSHETNETQEIALPETATATAPAAALTVEQRKERLLIAETRVRDHMMVSLGVGLLPFPLLDLAAAATAQITLVKRLCHLYEVPFSESRSRSIVTTLFGTLGVAGSALIIGASFSKLIPGSGTALGMLSLPLMAAAYTYAIGKLFIGHFEMGGTLADFESQKYSSYFRELYSRGKETAVSLLPQKTGATAAPVEASAAPVESQAQTS
jgi:uncharacterized protein (DUF697 family)